MTGNPTQTTGMPHILVVDDDERLRRLLKKYLSEHGFFVTAAANAKEARAQMALFVFDLMVLDVMMPGETGLELAQSLQKEKTTPPILLLTAMGKTENRIQGLETGADDYLVKPFEPRELLLRIKTILRRAEGQKQRARLVRFGPYAFDTISGKLTREGEPLYLTTGEVALLKALAEQAGQPVTREALARAASAAGAITNERSVDVQMSRLRRKIEPAGTRPVHIQTVRNAGYILYGE